MFASTLRRRIKFIKVSDLSTRAARQDFPWQKKFELQMQTAHLRNLETPVFKDILFWHLNEQFLPYTTTDFIFQTISVMVLCNRRPKAGKLFFCTKLNVCVSGYWKAKKCRQLHSELLKIATV